MACRYKRELQHFTAVHANSFGAHKRVKIWFGSGNSNSIDCRQLCSRLSYWSPRAIAWSLQRNFITTFRLQWNSQFWRQFWSKCEGMKINKFSQFSLTTVTTAITNSNNLISMMMLILMALLLLVSDEDDEEKN